MAKNTINWEDIGRNVQDIVDHAISSQDYQKLNQTIRQVVDRAMDIGEEAVRKAVENTGSRTQTAQPVQSVKKLDLSLYYAPTGGKTALNIVKIVGGSLIAIVSASLFTASAVIGLFLTGEALLPAIAVPLLAVGALLIGNGVSGLKRINRFKRYRKLLGQKTYCSLEKLARGIGQSVKSVRRDVRKLLADGYFPEGHLDKEESNLIITEETYQLFERSRLQLEQSQQEAKQVAKEAKQKKNVSSQLPQVQEVLDKGNAFIAEIRRCNDLIPGFEISEKISRIELIVQRIFERAASHPEIIPDLKKMMDYYLPMTVKLLNAYADMDAQPVQGETIRASKREIEQTLDTLNLAFEKLLDSVFEDTALDVSSDISVLQTLLAQEGLTEDGLGQIKKQRRGETL
ncbi:MAG: 5-bromo-4-chloroindolyl phosphate hydrolysis family protein [Oscillospiraceae bacterium]|nr:5-bromo-4-chloroindolyl phosphate hydrolysis family protein [Oscillospiraceae bacterium]